MIYSHTNSVKSTESQKSMELGFQPTSKTPRCWVSATCCLRSSAFEILYLLSVDLCVCHSFPSSSNAAVEAPRLGPLLSFCPRTTPMLLLYDMDAQYVAAMVKAEAQRQEVGYEAIAREFPLLVQPLKLMTECHNRWAMQALHACIHELLKGTF